MSHLTSHHTLPPFPENLKTAPLVSVRLSDLETHDEAESAAFFTACKDLGFFYLDMNGLPLGEALIVEAEKLNVVQKEFYSLANEVKEEYRVDKFYSYRFEEFQEDGQAKRNEDYNLRKDDILGNCTRLPCHPLIIIHQDLLKSYTLHCRQIVDLLLSLLEHHLRLPTGTLAQLHRVDHRSGDHVRFIQAAPQAYDEDRAGRNEHTDFGSITILFNWLGGLQIRLPSDDDNDITPSTTETNQKKDTVVADEEPEAWVYVKPVPGSCIINLGDALLKFTSGILRSSIHRVIPPPPPQNTLTRNSLVYFSRPEDDVVLRRLKGGLIDEQPEEEEGVEEMTSDDWIMRRAFGDLHGVFTKRGLEKRELDLLSIPVALRV